MMNETTNYNREWLGLHSRIPKEYAVFKVYKKHPTPAVVQEKAIYDDNDIVATRPIIHIILLTTRCCLDIAGDRWQ